MPPSDVNVGLDSPHENYSYLRKSPSELGCYYVIGIINQLSYRLGAPHCTIFWWDEYPKILAMTWWLLSTVGFVSKKRYLLAI